MTNLNDRHARLLRQPSGWQRELAARQAHWQWLLQQIAALLRVNRSHAPEPGILAAY